MKETKRALRRHQFRTKFEQRIKVWFKDSYYYGDGSAEESIARVRKGERSNWVRTTGTPCSCWGCSGSTKFVREQKQYIDINLD